MRTELTILNPDTVTTMMDYPHGRPRNNSFLEPCSHPPQRVKGWTLITSKMYPGQAILFAICNNSAKLTLAKINHKINLAIGFLHRNAIDAFAMTEISSIDLQLFKKDAVNAINGRVAW